MIFFCDVLFVFQRYCTEENTPVEVIEANTRHVFISSIGLLDVLTIDTLEPVTRVSTVYLSPGIW